MLIAMCLPCQRINAQWVFKVSYGILSEDNRVLTVYRGTPPKDIETVGFGHIAWAWEYNKETDKWSGISSGSNTVMEHADEIEKIIFDESFDSIDLRYMSGWFNGLTALKSVEGLENIVAPDLTGVAHLFANCTSLESIDLSGFDTQNVMYMEGLFEGCTSLKEIKMGGKFSTKNVVCTNYMFSGCTSLEHIDMTGFDTSNLYYANCMFANCSSLKSIDLSSSNLSNLIQGNYLFYGCSSLGTINWGTSVAQNAKYIKSMFEGCTSLKELDLGNFNPTNLTNMSKMFYGCSSLKSIYVGQDWNLGNVIFPDGSVPTSPFSINKNLITIDPRGPKVFEECVNLVGGNGTTYDAKHTDHTYARIDGGTANPGYFTSKKQPYAVLSDDNTVLTFYFDDQIEARGGMSVGPFTKAATLSSKKRGEADASPAWYGDRKSITTAWFDDSFANYANLTSTAYWFNGCSHLSTITGISNLKTANVTNMNNMFQNCSSLTTLDLSLFNTAKVTDMSGMFMDCSQLKTIYVGIGWSMECVTNSAYMFYNCVNLVGGSGTTYDANHVDDDYTHIDGGTANPGYFTQSPLTTGIQQPKAKEDGAWYSLDGRCIVGNPARTGVYLKNGRKVVVRADH